MTRPRPRILGLLGAAFLFLACSGGSGGGGAIPVTVLTPPPGSLVLGDVVTVKVEGLQSLTSVLQGGHEPRVLQRVAFEFGRLVGEFHRHGFLHADLTTENTLVESASLDSDEPVLWTLDLDKSEFTDDLTDGERRDNLRRLLRCIDRRDRDGAATLALRARFFRGYDPDGERWKDDWRAIAQAARRNRWAHVTGWFLERAAGNTASRREKGLGYERPEASG